MMDIKQMVDVLGMSRNAVQRIVRDAGIKAETRSFRHGKKLYYPVTPERLIELKKNKDPEYISIKKDESMKALVALEKVLGKIHNSKVDAVA